jgi:hypothetical protein
MLHVDGKSQIYKSDIHSATCCCYKVLFRTLREEHRLTVFENRLLRRILGPKGDEVAELWRKLCNEELHDIALHKL